MRWVDHAPVRALERANLCHLAIAELEIKHRKVGGEMVRIGGARNRDDPLLDEIVQCDL